MKNSLKMIVGMLLIVVFSIGQASAVNRQPKRSTQSPEYQKEYQRSLSDTNADNTLRHNAQVLPYVPSDIKGVAGEGTYCDAHGIGQDPHITGGGRCFEYRSKSEGSKWMIRYARAGVRVFKVRKNESKLWAAFGAEPDVYAVTYSSPEAQKFASAHGGNTGVAKNQDEEPSGNPVQEANKTHPEDVIKKGLGTILPGVFR